MAYASLFGSALAYGLFFSFASRGDLTGFTALTFLTPVFALLCGFLLLEERLAPLQWLGAALALVSVLLINRRDQFWQPAVAGASGGADGGARAGGPAPPEAGVASGPAHETEAG
jgi:drug/metabolite transporter (DMT)-like permease